MLGAAAATHAATLAAVVRGFEAVGTLWINAVRMTVVPLVVALVITGVVSTADSRRVGRLGALALPVFLAFLLTGGVFTLLVAPLSLDRLVISPETAESLRAGGAAVSAGAAGTGAPQMPSLVQRIVEMVPANPVKAAADGAMLPLVVFTLLLGLALTRLEPGRREPVVQWFQAVADAMLVLVNWVLIVAPIGILGLAVGLGFRMGAAAAGALLHYVITLSAMLLVYILALYPVAVLLGKAPIRTFAGAAAPAQAVAFSSRSSLAALPAMITGAKDRLGLPAAVTGFALPLAVSVFRVNVPIAWVVGVLFLGKLYGVPLDLAPLGGLIVTSTLISFSVPGIPSASLFLMAPVVVDLGLPAEGVGILIAVDAIPDLFKTTANVTAHLASVTILARYQGAPLSYGAP
ncbi:MAG: cation:dicarboxylase symporter family transporter [Gemmatimonadetes bacterium]|nr:cation:dicarboxylase symporter family transporter [Gemmatimonadota bacterium]